MKITGQTSVVTDNANKLTDPKVKKEEKAAQEAFKTVFLEKMIGEMMKTTNVSGEKNSIQKDFYQEELTKAVADQIMNSPDMRWNELFKDVNLKGKE